MHTHTRLSWLVLALFVGACTPASQEPGTQLALSQQQDDLTAAVEPEDGIIPLTTRDLDLLIGNWSGTWWVAGNTMTRPAATTLTVRHAFDSDIDIPWVEYDFDWRDYRIVAGRAHFAYGEREQAHGLIVNDCLFLRTSGMCLTLRKEGNTLYLEGTRTIPSGEYKGVETRYRFSRDLG